jgi:hypothetical protein
MGKTRPMSPLVRTLRAMTAAKARQGEDPLPTSRGWTWGTRFCGRFLEAVEGDEEEVDGEGHPEGDEDVGDVEAGVEVGADAGGQGEGGVEAARSGFAWGETAAKRRMPSA